MIVIPMAGLSRRFTEAGYTVPKYMLPIDGKSVFYHAIQSFESLFQSVPFVFIARSVAETEAFIERECAALGVRNVRIVILDRETAGQAETVALGLKLAGVPDDQPVTIFNIDTFRPSFRYPEAAWFGRSDGYLEVFEGEGANWSYVGPVADADEPLVLRTTEKQPISNLCCDGLYHFRSARDFLSALEVERSHPSMPELYVAPLYNHLIAANKKIHFDIVAPDMITFCGVPAEYEALITPRG